MTNKKVALLFGSRLASVMKRRKVTVAKMAQIIGVSRHTVMRWRSGEIIPSGYDMTRMAEYLDTSGRWLMGFDASPGRMVSLTPDERLLVDRYRSLTAGGKESLLEALVDIARAEQIYQQRD